MVRNQERGKFPNWYNSGGWKETIHMPNGVTYVADCYTLPLHLSALRRDRNGGSREEIDSYEDIQEVLLANHNHSRSASYDGLSSFFNSHCNSRTGRCFSIFDTHRQLSCHWYRCKNSRSKKQRREKGAIATAHQPGLADDISTDVFRSLL